MWSNKRKFEVRRMFKSADENGDGALESAEILWLCGKMGEARDPVSWSLCRCVVVSLPTEVHPWKHTHTNRTDDTGENP